MNERQNKIQDLIVYFCKELSEDPQDGTEFDCDVIRALRKVEEKYKD